LPRLLRDFTLGWQSSISWISAEWEEGGGGKEGERGGRGEIESSRRLHHFHTNLPDLTSTSITASTSHYLIEKGGRGGEKKGEYRGRTDGGRLDPAVPLDGRGLEAELVPGWRSSGVARAVFGIEPEG